MKHGKEGGGKKHRPENTALFIFKTKDTSEDKFLCDSRYNGISRKQIEIGRNASVRLGYEGIIKREIFRKGIKTAEKRAQQKSARNHQDSGADDEKNGVRLKHFEAEPLYIAFAVPHAPHGTGNEEDHQLKDNDAEIFIFAVDQGYFDELSEYEQQVSGKDHRAWGQHDQPALFFHSSA